MSNDKLDMIKQLADLLLLEETRAYNVGQLVQRFASVESIYRHDQVIRNIGGVLETMAERNPDAIVDRHKIAELFNTFSRMSSGSKFKEAFGDLLPQDVVEKFINTPSAEETDYVYRNRADFVDEGNRDLAEVQEEAIEVSELEAAVDQPTPVLGLETFDPGQSVVHDRRLIDEGVQLTVSQLQSIGCGGARAKLKYAVQNCLLYAASFPVPQGKMVVNIPILIEAGRLQIPEVFSDLRGVRLYRFSTDGLNEMLYDSIEDRENEQLDSINRMRQDDVTSDIRSAGDETFEVSETETYIAELVPTKLPAELADIGTILEDAVIRSESQYTPEWISKASHVVARELAKLGYKNNDVHFAGDNEDGVLFDATLQTGKGKVTITVPVEVVSGNILFPTKFAADDGQIHELNSQELNGLTKNDQITDPVRYSSILVEMDYNTLRKIIHSAVFDRKLSVAQEALHLIHDKFGTEAHNNSVADFQLWCEEAGQDHHKRCGSCPFYRPGGARGSTSSVDQCGLLHTPCNKVVKTAGICKKASVAFDSVRDEGYKGIISGHDIRLS